VASQKNVGERRDLTLLLMVALAIAAAALSVFMGLWDQPVH
jgi:hypothetical protein